MGAMSRKMSRLVWLGGVLLLTGCVPPRTAERPRAIDRYIEGMAKLEQGRDDEAIDALEDAVMANATLRMAHRTLGDLYRERRKWLDALPHYEAAAELDPYTSSNHYFLGLTYQVLEQLEAAAASYNRAIELDPEYFAAHMNLGLTHFALGDLDQAMVHLERATKIDGNSARAWTNLGVVQDARGNAVFAEASYRRALEIDGKSAATMLNLAGNLINQGKANDAVLVAEMLVQASGTPTTYKRLGDAYTVARRWDDAAGAYDKALEPSRSFSPALNAKAEMRIMQFSDGLELDDKLRVEAIALWEESLKANPGQPAVENELSRWRQLKIVQ
jgi:tetratricopeptide (TPR) repeat protein